MPESFSIGMGKQRSLCRRYITSGRGIVGAYPEDQTARALTVKESFIEICLFLPDRHKK